MRGLMALLRTRTLLVRLLLAWFVCALGVAVASPMVKPKTMDIVCSASGGVHLVVVGDDGQAETAGPHTLDCSLCLNATTPPLASSSPSLVPQPLAHALRPRVAAHIASLVGAPLPPRGPPALC